MPFTVEDFLDLLRKLEDNPEWRAALRRHVLSDDVLELPALVRQLAETQARMVERLEGVERRQGRVEAALARLADAQARTEKQIAALGTHTDEQFAAQAAHTDEPFAEQAAHTDEPFAAQAAHTDEQFAAQAAHTDERFAAVDGELRQLKISQGRLAREVGVLGQIVGATAEDTAQDALVVLFSDRGSRLLEPPRTIQLDGEGEMDVAVPVESPDGQRLWVIVEAKVRLHESQVVAWAQRVWAPEWRRRLARFGFEGPYLPYLFGLRWSFSLPKLERAVAEGRLPPIGLLGPQGELLPPPVLPAA